MNIWILDSDSGITLLYKPYMDLPINEDLVSGLLTALNQFTIMEFKGQGIESIDMGGLRWVYVIEKELNLLFIAAAGKEDKAEILRARLNIIKQAFIQKYIRDGKWRENWNGNTEIFAPFTEILNEYYSNWLAVKKVTTIAEFVDILGIFQQLFFNILAILRRISEDSRERIYKRIEIMFENYRNNPYIKKNPELYKLSFSRLDGIDIISINPNKCDFVVVERQIINLMRKVVEAFKKELGYLKCLEYFAQENVLDYILNNLSLLSELKIDKFLLQLFLLK